jgi:hypothetical protein
MVKLALVDLVVESFPVLPEEMHVEHDEYGSTMCTVCTNDVTNCLCACGAATE